MYAEENFLRKKFGIHYLDWAVKTPAIIPSFKNYKKPKVKFSWRKVLKKEKNGFAAVFLLFWFFEALGESLKHQHILIELNFWSIAAFSSLIMYFILKFIKKKTTLFDEESRRVFTFRLLGEDCRRVAGAFPELGEVSYISVNTIPDHFYCEFFKERSFFE
jgi:hypothetical protein